MPLDTFDLEWMRTLPKRLSAADVTELRLTRRRATEPGERRLIDRMLEGADARLRRERRRKELELRLAHLEQVRNTTSGQALRATHDSVGERRFARAFQRNGRMSYTEAHDRAAAIAERDGAERAARETAEIADIKRELRELRRQDH